MIDILQELGITHILNCALEFNQGSDGKPFVDYKVPDGVIIHHLNMIDEPGQPMNFEDSFKFIDDALNGTKTTQLHSSCSALNHQSKIFVHCYMGVSRSASVVIEYLMEKYHLTLNQAYKIVYHQRSVIFPNFGFMKQLYLKEYELVDQIGVEDQQLQKLPKNDNNQYMSKEIDLRKRIQPLNGIQEISKLPELNDRELIQLFKVYQVPYNQAKDEWNQRRSVEDKEQKKTQYG
ncbi:MAG: hypothetical protein EZS28_011148 [Streblomastix strix]|uniref:protein-tyrosine-phosphatase n=1 Tax=Streblomastix strix TaxID=222440 RepID=A0A5J4WEC6_9EUKA|nr:MAG: hypothetical protein EZS28_011148 [Streblomastix strix]